MLTFAASAWSWLAGSRLGRLVAAVGGALAGFFLLRAYWLRQGGKRVLSEQRDADRASARKAREDVDAALDDARDVSVADRLRRQGQLRD